jgi:hypothetical protein
LLAAAKHRRFRDRFDSHAIIIAKGIKRVGATEGAMGVVVPFINTPEQARFIVQFTKKRSAKDSISFAKPKSCL